MSKLNVFCLIASLLCYLAAGLSAQSVSEGLQKHVEQICEEYLSDEKNHQIAVGIIDGEDYYQYYLANPNHPDEPALGDSSVFELGGLSKVYTALLTLQLQEEGVLRAEESITQFLPDSLKEQNSELEDLTIHDLITHHGGLPRQMGGTVELSDPYLQYDRALLFDKLSRLRFLSKARFMYSHFGYGILTEVLSLASDQSFHELLQKKITKPQGLNMTFADNCPRELLAPGFRFNGSASDYWTFPIMAGTEGMESNLPDLLSFTRLFLEADEGSVYAKALEIQEKSSRRGVFVSWGWHVFRKGKKSPDIYTHAGRTGGFSSYVAFVPDKNIAVVVLANSRNAVDLIGIDLLELLNR